MTLPLSRNTTYSAGSQLLSADLNDIQDQIIGGLHGYRWVAVEQISSAVASGAATFVGDVWSMSPGLDAIEFRLPVVYGDNVRAVAMRCKPTVNTNVRIDIVSGKDGGGGGLPDLTGTISTNGTAWEWVVADYGAGTEAEIPTHEDFLRPYIFALNGADTVYVSKIMMLISRTSNELSPPL